MKLLLDENLPHQLRYELPGHNVATVAFMNWCGISNGDLLRLANEGGFDAVITNDRGLEHDQNPAQLPIAVVILMSLMNTIDSIRPHIPELLSTLADLGVKKLAIVPK